ncbi:MAG: dipeptide ABC transporter ATP-binding protein [Gammaproteobacteria bacterium]|nr:dipeptide ABC transporter ATP-binding protein [Gammaproteobacteria bacterium]
MTALLNVDSLTVRFGSDAPAVAGVSFQIQAGETLALLGESGSGKSVTALSLLRLLPGSAAVNGSIRLRGRDLVTLSARRLRDLRGRQLAMIFQEPHSSLNPALTVGVQVGEALRRRGLRGRALRQRVVELLAAVELPDPDRRLHDYPHQYSGGMKQRVMLAMALAGEPELLIADEPTTALDVTTQARILALLHKLQRETGMAMLFITHDLAVAAQVADRVAVMYRGGIVETGPARTFFRQPQHAYSRQLLEVAGGANSGVGTQEGEQKGAQRLGGSGLQQGSETSSVANVPAPPAGDNKQPLLQVNNLHIRFPIKPGWFGRPAACFNAVDGVSLTLARGRTLALVGESGSGKTTLGKGILQLLQPAAGTVCLAGESLSELSPQQLRRRRTHIQVVFQDPFSSMDPQFKVKDIIEEGMIALGTAQTAGQRQASIDRLLEQVGLEPAHKYRYPHEFSGGQRQRICIARALAVQPQLLVCDEPTSALDVTVQARIMALLTELQQQLDLACLFITHNVNLISNFAHEVAVMHRGKIVEQGETTQVLAAPRHEYTRALLAAVPRVRVQSSSDVSFPPAARH